MASVDTREANSAEALREVTLLQNHPNPFNASTVISYYLPNPAQVSLKICNLTGQELATLHVGHQAVGFHRILWDGGDAKGLPVPSGVYLYRLEAGNVVQTKQMVLVR